MDGYIGYLLIGVLLVSGVSAYKIFGLDSNLDLVRENLKITEGHLKDAQESNSDALKQIEDLQSELKQKIALSELLKRQRDSISYSIKIQRSKNWDERVKIQGILDSLVIDVQKWNIENEKFK